MAREFPELITFRAKPHERALLDAAARENGVNRSEFLRRSLQDRALQVLGRSDGAQEKQQVAPA